MHTYRPVVFLSGGEDGVCGGRSFESRRHAEGGFLVTEKATSLTFRAANLGEIRVGIESVVNGGPWLSPLSLNCEITNQPFNGVMYDAKTPHGWANINHDTFTALGCRLGTGLGQKYVEASDCRWYKVKGVKRLGEQELRVELASTGLPWSIETGSKHLQIRMCGHLVGILPRGKGGDDRRAYLNIRSQIRRKAKELK